MRTIDRAPGARAGKRQPARCCAVFLFLLLFFCTAAERAHIQAAEPALTVKEKTVYVGTDYQIRAKNLASTAKLTYKSSDKKIAVVSAKGVVTPKAKGTATLTVTIKQNGKTYTRTIALTVKEPYVSISNQKKKLVQSSDYLLTGRAYGVSGAEFTFSSSDVLVAKVDKTTGMVHARGAGKAVITMKDSTSGLTASFTLTVVEKTEENQEDVYVSTETFGKSYSFEMPEDASEQPEETQKLLKKLEGIQKRITAGQSITIQEMTDYYLYKSQQKKGKK